MKRRCAPACRHAVLVARAAALERAVEPAEETRVSAWCSPLRDRLQHRRAQRRREHDRDQHRQRHRRDDGRRELPIDDAGRAGHEGHRHEHRRQHQADADQRAGDLVHRLARRFERRQALLAHQALDVLDHDDGVVDQQADRQHHREHRQHVDREAERGEHAERAEQHHRHGDGRDQRGAEVLQEQVHHQEHQHDRLEQRRHDTLDRHPHERRRVERHDRLQAGRKERPQLVQRPLDALAVSSALAPVASEIAMPRRRLPVVAADELVVLGAELDARDVAELER